jgi:hypothetical protein
MKVDCNLRDLVNLPGANVAFIHALSKWVLTKETLEVPKVERDYWQRWKDREGYIQKVK